MKILFAAAACACGYFAFAQPPSGVRVVTAPHGTPSVFTNIPADAPSRKLQIASETPVRVFLGTDYYENNRLVRQDQKFVLTPEQITGTELVFRTDSEGHLLALLLFHVLGMPQTAKALPFKENHVGKGLFGDGTSSENGVKGVKVPIALLYHEKNGQDDIASRLGAVDGVVRSGDLYQKIENLPEKMGTYVVIYYVLEDVEK